MSGTSTTLIDRFKNASSSTRTGVFALLTLIVLLVVGTFLTSESKSDPKLVKQPERQNIISNSNRASTNEDLAGEIAQTKKELSDQKNQILLLAEAERQKNRGASEGGNLTDLSVLTAQLQVMQDRLSSIESGKPGLPTPGAQAKPNSVNPLDPGVGRDGELVLGPDGFPLTAPVGSDGKTLGVPGQTGAQQGSKQPIIQVVTAEKKIVSDAKKQTKPTPSAYISSGSNFEGVLLNGMDASTSIGANKTPTPALLRVKTDAILPNLFTFDVKECFVLVGGYGNMSTERVEMRTETMSCVDQGGQVWEGKIEGYVVGEDGKAGARGRIVSKQGALLAKSFMAGFIGGVGGAFSPQSQQSLLLNTTGQTSDNYQFPGANSVLGGGISKGLNQAGTALAEFYIRLAEQMFPIVELDAGRKMTIILLKGIELKMDKRL